jgi:hypothetical protein
MPAIRHPAVSPRPVDRPRAAGRAVARLAGVIVREVERAVPIPQHEIEMRRTLGR